MRQNCLASGCPNKRSAKGYCPKHYQRLKRLGDANAPVRLKGQRGSINKAGYRRFRAAGRGSKEILEHRMIMEQILGRKLLVGEIVHHINGNKLDNRPCNLELWITKQPAGQRPEDLVRYAKEILAVYDKE